jgi:hypothetical protein
VMDRKETLTADALARAFDALDAKADGLLDAADLSSALAAQRVSLPPAALAALMARDGLARDGRPLIRKATFQEYMLRVGAPRNGMCLGGVAEKALRCGKGVVWSI